MIRFLNEIETNYPVDQVKVNGVSIWPLLRTSFYVSYGNKYENIVWSSQKSKKLSYFSSAIAIIKSFPKLMHRFDYIFLSESNERRMIDGKFYDKLFDSIIDEFGRKQSILFELPVNGRININAHIHTKNTCTSLIFYYIAKVLPRPNFNIENVEILDIIIERYRLKIDYFSTISLYLKYCRIAEFFLSKLRPKILFIKCYYSPLNQAFIGVAKNLNIKTVEVQHGIISSDHPSYNIFTDLNKHLFPEYILTNGQVEKQLLSKTNHPIFEKIIPVGNFYLENISKIKNLPSNEFIQSFSFFKKIVLVTLQDTVEETTLDFIEKAAVLDKNILYVVIPRNYNLKYNYLNEKENILVNEQLNFYDLVHIIEIHCTVYSTCAIEAAYLGSRNLLLDIKGKAKKFFKGILEENDYNIYVNKPDELVISINSSKEIPRELIKMNNSFLCESNYIANIKNFLAIMQKE